MIQIEHVMIAILLVIVVMMAVTGRKYYRRRLKPLTRLWRKTKDKIPRPWQPKSPADCPHCVAGIELTRIRRPQAMVPYAQVKSPRGRKKRVRTAGLACPHPECDYYGEPDDSVHALVGYGKTDKRKKIQRLRCQACLTTFSCRLGTPLYYLKSDEREVEMVLWFLAEGVDMSVMVRFTGRVDATIARWLRRLGQHSVGWHDIWFRKLTLVIIQMDELYAKVRGCEKPRWLWLAIDPISKAIPSLHLGRRKNGDAYALVHDLQGRLADECVPAFTTDGLRGYFYAVTAHFGRWFRPFRAQKDHWQVDEKLLYGQLIKRKLGRKLQYAITRMLWGNRSDLTQLLQQHGFSYLIQTAFIERVNLTFRQSVAPLTRRTWSLAQSEQALLDHVQWFRLYYHLARPHESLRLPVPGWKRRYRARSPAMALGLTDRVWTVGEILHTPLFALTPAV